jgi:membrane complex biogenesis BtpA family protein
MPKTPAVFEDRKLLIGMVHVGALPGSPGSRLSIAALVDQAVQETEILVKAGFDSLIIENMHDRPYVHQEHGPETVAAMTAVGLAVRQAAGPMPLGIQVLSGGNREALAVALAAGLQFIRCENFVFSHVADEGLLVRAEAGPLLRYRKQIGADQVQIYCDIKKKHASHAVTADVTLAEAAEAAEFFGADGLIVTGTATGKPTAPEDVAKVREVAPRLPLLVGSGVTADRIPAVIGKADALIVGSSIKKGGVWSNPVDRVRAATLVRAFKSAVQNMR